MQTRKLNRTWILVFVLCVLGSVVGKFVWDANRGNAWYQGLSRDLEGRSQFVRLLQGQQHSEAFAMINREGAEEILYSPKLMDVRGSQKGSSLLSLYALRAYLSKLLNDQSGVEANVRASQKVLDPEIGGAMKEADVLSLGRSM